MANRTAKGTVTQSARDKHGEKGSGRFPIFDQKSAMSALKLRGRARSKAERLSIINRAARYAPAAARAAREADRKSGAI